MTSTTFRDSVNSLGWSRRDPDIPANTAASSSSPFLSRLQSLNPFSDRSGYVSLPTQEGPGAPLPAPTRREEEEGFFALSRWDRLLIFAACNLAAAACFAICITLFLVLATRPTKFAILWSMGSLLFLASWTILLGPRTYFHHLASGPRLPFTAVYFGSIALTLIFAFQHLTILTLLAAIVQLLALVWYLVSYFPMGSTGLRFAARFGTNRVAAWMTD